MSNIPEQLVYNPDLVGNHIHAVAEIENQQPFDSVSEKFVAEDPILYDAGVIVAKACLAVSAGRRRAGTRLLDQARDRLQEITDESHSFDKLVPYQQLEGQIALYRGWARPFMRASLREQTVTEARLALQAQTITDLGQFALLSRRDRENVKIGTVAELATIGILERQHHPWHLTTYALPHHDQGRLARLNFDTLTSVSVPGKQPELYRAQCKLGCLGLCSHIYSDLTEDQITYRNYARRRIASTASTVKEISGCCDLELRNKNKLSSYKSTRTLLTLEAQGEATPTQIGKLDTLSNSVLLEMTLPTRITHRNAALPIDKRSQRSIDLREQRNKQRTEADERRAAARIGIAQVIGSRSKIAS